MTLIESLAKHQSGRNEYLNDGAAEQRGFAQVEWPACVLLDCLSQPGGCQAKAGGRLGCLFRRELHIASVQVACARWHNVCPHAMLTQGEAGAQGIMACHQCIEGCLQVPCVQ